MLTAAPQVYVGVSTSAGPHVTPELFTISGDRIVCLTAASTLKARITRNRPQVAVAARSSSGVVSAVGNAELFDPADPGTAIDAPRTMATSPVDVARFVRDNAAELTGAMRDAVTGRLGVPPEHRVVLSIRVDDAAVEDQVSSDVVLGWTREGDGAPLALPATLVGDDQVTVSSALFEAMRAASSSSACVTSDAWTGLGPLGKEGAMRRGSGVAERDGASVRVTLSIDRTIEWDGLDVRSTTNCEGTPGP